MMKNELYWKIWNWYHYKSPIFINTLNVFKPIRTWWKARKYFRFPSIKFRYGKAGEVATSIWHGSNNRAKWFDLNFCDVFWKMKFDNSVFEAEPCINLILFGKWQFLWIFGCPKVSYNENNYMYWEALLDYVYDYYDIYITKEQFGWVSYITDENGNEDKVTCWTDEWLTKKGKEKVKYESDKWNKYCL